MDLLRGRGGRRHLSASEVADVLHRGGEIAQLLTYEPAPEGRKTIRYLTLRSAPGHLVLAEHHVVEADPCVGGLADLAEMADVSTWAPTIEQLGQGVHDPAESHHDSVGQVLSAARSRGASDERWTNGSMIDAEYDDLRARHS